jgi:hypothetical protein
MNLCVCIISDRTDISRFLMETLDDFYCDNIYFSQFCMDDKNSHPEPTISYLNLLAIQSAMVIYEFYIFCFRWKHSKYYTLRLFGGSIDRIL